MAPLSLLNKQVPIIVLCGPTASGKSALACQIAERFDAEIVSADSRQVYRYMDIGTAKPTPAERSVVRHHLIDIVDPDEPFSVADFVVHAGAAIADIVNRGRLPLVVGGTGLYIRALTEGLADVPASDDSIRDELLQQEQKEGTGTLYRRLQEIDPQQAQGIHPNNLVRLVRALEVYELSGVPMSEFQQQHQFAENRYRALKLYLHWPRDVLYGRIEERVDQMISHGLLAEVQKLLDSGYSADLKAMKAIGYRELVACLNGKYSLEEAVAQIKQETRRYAKRQETWFKKEKSIISVDSLSEIDKIQQLIEYFPLQKGSGYGQNTI